MASSVVQDDLVTNIFFLVELILHLESDKKMLKVIRNVCQVVANQQTYIKKRKVLYFVFSNKEKTSKQPNLTEFTPRCRIFIKIAEFYLFFRGRCFLSSKTPFFHFIVCDIFCFKKFLLKLIFFEYLKYPSNVCSRLTPLYQHMRQRLLELHLTQYSVLNSSCTF